MTELEILQRAKMYIDKMANGVNPIDDAHVPDADTLNNVRISRCLSYVSGILGQVIENNGIIGKTKTLKKAFFLSDGAINKFSFSETPIPISEITNRLNALMNSDLSLKLSRKIITSWLMEIDVLEEIITAEGKKVRWPTERGSELGIYVEKRTGMNGEYSLAVYGREAQQFILDNIQAIISYANNIRKDTQPYKYPRRSWDAAQDKHLIELFNKNMPVSEISTILKRSEGGIRARLKKLGLIENRSDAL